MTAREDAVQIENLYNEISAKEKLLEQEQDDFDEQLLDTEVENQND